MLRLILVASLVAVAAAQVLRISPQVIGSSSPGAEYVINLGSGGSAPRAVPARAAAFQYAPAHAPARYSWKPAARLSAQPLARFSVQPVARFSAQPVARFSAHPDEADHNPTPFAFSFDSEDEFGTKMGRSESGDGNGKVEGSYSFSDGTGISRTVTYIADSEGFRADVKTNEPGTISSNPADVTITSAQQ